VDLVFGLVAMTSSSTLESDSLPVRSEMQSTKRCYKSQSRQLKNEGEKNSMLCANWSALCTSMHFGSAYTAHKIYGFIWACTLCGPSLNSPRSTPDNYQTKIDIKTVS